MKFAFYLGASYLLFLLLNINIVFAGEIEGFKELEVVAKASNPAWPFVIEAHPFTVFEDSYEYLRNNLPDFQLLKVKFVDDEKVDVTRWIHLMSAQIFAPSFRLFERVWREGEASPSTPPSMVYSGPTGRGEEMQLEYLRVAGRFCGRLVQMGRVLNYRFVPEVYQRILNSNDILETQSTSKIRLSAFVKGMLEAIPGEKLVNISPSGLESLINGLTFAAVPTWKPKLTIDFEDFKHQDLLNPDDVKRVYNELGTEDVALLWFALSGMRGIPIAELSSHAKGLTLKAVSATKFSVTGLYLDFYTRTLEVCPWVFESHPTNIWEYFKNSLTPYATLEFFLRRIPSFIGRSPIELPRNDDSKIIDALCALPCARRDVIRSQIIVADKDSGLILGEARFFFLAFFELLNPASGLFKISWNESAGRIADISLEAVDDEARHLSRLHAAGVVWGKAQISAYQVGFALAPKLESLIVPGTSPMPNDNISEKDASLFNSRSAAFIRGIRDVIPAWVHPYLVLPSNGHPHPATTILPRTVRQCIRLTFKVPKVSKNLRRRAEAVKKWFWNAASKSDYAKSRLFFLLLVGRPVTHVANLLLEPTSRWKLVFDPMAVSIKISEGTIVLPNCESQDSMTRLVHSALGPVKYARLLAGVPAPEQHYSLTAPRGQLFKSLYALYLEAGLEQFIKWRLQIIVFEEGREVKELGDPADYGFLLLEEALNAEKNLFVYSLDEFGFGSYGISRKPVEDEEAHLSMLRFVGVFLAKLVALEDVALDFPLNQRLQDLLYMGEEGFKASSKAVQPFSPRESSLLSGFHSVIPETFFQSITLNEWKSYVDFKSNTEFRLMQQEAISNYGYFMTLSRLHVKPDFELEEENFATWKDYEDLAADTPLTVALPPVREPHYLSRLIDEVLNRTSGLFIDEGDATLKLSKDVVETGEKEDTRLKKLHLVGYLIGKGIQSSVPIGHYFDRSLYARLGRKGRALGDELMPEMELKRIYAFIDGIFAAIPSDAFATLTEEEIALLFEWDTQPIAILAKSVFQYKAFPEGSDGHQCMKNFHKAITSLPDEVGRQFILQFRDIIRIPLDGFDQLSVDSIKVDAGVDDIGALLNIDVMRSRVGLWAFASVEELKAAICVSLLNDNLTDNEELIKSMKLKLEEQVMVLQFFLEANEPPLQLTIDRHDIFGSTFKAYANEPTDFEPRQTEIQFVGADGASEAGKDAGGLSNEWISLFFKQIVESKDGLFYESLAGQHYCFYGKVPKSSSDDLHQQYEFIGTMVGRAFLSGVPISMRFAPIVYDLLVHGLVPEFDYYAALKTFDPKAYTVLELARTSDNPEQLGLDFTLVDSSTGSLVYLKSAEDNPEVTKETVDEYVALMARHVLLGESRTCVEAFVNGFHVMVDPDDIESFGFTAGQIQSLIFGIETIDVDDWRKNTFHTGLDPKDTSPHNEWYRKAVEWFWATLEAFDLEQRRNVLHYATGLLRVPFGGFKGLPGGRFVIAKASSPTPHRMPEAVTCSNAIWLHPYDSEDELRAMLLKAIEWAGEGFGNI